MEKNSCSLISTGVNKKRDMLMLPANVNNAKKKSLLLLLLFLSLLSFERFELSHIVVSIGCFEPVINWSIIPFFLLYNI